MSMLGGVMRSQRGVARFPEILWADLYALSPAAYKGRIFYVPDIGSSAFMTSDGTYWVPVNGSLVLDSKSNPGISTTSTTLVQLAGWSLVIPAGLFKKPAAMLRGIIRGKRTGTLSTTGSPTIKIGWDTNTSRGLVATGSSTTANDGMRGQSVLSRVDDTQVLSANMLGASSSNLGVANDSSETTLQTLDATVATTFYSYGKVGDTPGSGETTWIDEIIVELIVP